MITITILTENRPSPTRPELLCEHGLSVWVESPAGNFLVDAGASDVFVRNAGMLGVDLATTTAIILSHAHRDHTGGMAYLPDSLKNKPIYCTNNLFQQKCYSVRGGVRHDISAPALKIARNLPELPIKLISAEDFGYPQPVANRYLSIEKDGVEVADDFAHELTVVLPTSEGLVIISPCSHRGVANIIATCQRVCCEERVVAFIGGLHLPDYEGVESEARLVANSIRQVAPEAHIYTGHCTSDRAIEVLGELLPNLHKLHTGLKIEI